MGKRILIISASPRKMGNSDLICDEFLRGANDAGNLTEKIWLPEKNINYCSGCCKCIGGTGVCSQNDDMGEIIKKVLAADVIVLSTPVYFHSMNAQLKTMIDRICPVYSQVRNKDFYYIISSAGGRTEIEKTAQSLQTFTSCLPGSKEKGIISVTGIWDAGRVRGSSVLTEAYSIGSSII